MAESTGSGSGRGDGEEDALPPAAERLPSTLRSEASYRAVLALLAAHGERCSLSTLTAALVEEADWPPDGAAASNPYQLTHLALVRQYLPVLSEFDVLDYDEEAGTVTLAGRGHEPRGEGALF